MYNNYYSMISFSSESKESPDDMVDRELVIFRRPSNVSSGECK